MIISRSSNFIFYHVPKTGGSTVRLALQSLLQENDILVGGNRKRNQQEINRLFKRKVPLVKHSTPDEVISAIGAEDYSKFRIAAFVRNPFARLFSAYRYIGQRSSAEGIHHKGLTYNYSSFSFEDFLDSPLVGRGGKFAARPQTDWLPDVCGVHFIGKTENLEEDLRRFGRGIGGRFSNLDIPGPANESGPREEWRGMSRRAQNIIVEKFSNDFSCFGYSTYIS